MAAGSAAKENTPPPPVAASRRRGYAVKSCGVKKRARLLGRRVPLRDITNLIEAAISAAAGAGPEAPLLAQQVPPARATELTKPDAVVVRLAALQDGGDAAAGPAAKVARYSLLKGFR